MDFARTHLYHVMLVLILRTGMYFFTYVRNVTKKMCAMEYVSQYELCMRIRLHLRGFRTHMLMLCYTDTYLSNRPVSVFTCLQSLQKCGDGICLNDACAKFTFKVGCSVMHIYMHTHQEPMDGVKDHVNSVGLYQIVCLYGEDLCLYGESAYKINGAYLTRQTYAMKHAYTVKRAYKARVSITI